MRLGDRAERLVIGRTSAVAGVSVPRSPVSTAKMHFQRLSAIFISFCICLLSLRWSWEAVVLISIWIRNADAAILAHARKGPSLWKEKGKKYLCARAWGICSVFWGGGGGISLQNKIRIGVLKTACCLKGSPARGKALGLISALF